MTPRTLISVASLYESLAPNGASISLCSFNKYMTFSVPDSFNMDELEKALELAPREEDLGRAVIDNSDDDKELTSEYIEKIAQECLEAASEKCPDPLVHKVMAMMIVSRMIAWHNTMAEHQLEEGNRESAACWYRDAGKFQSMMDSFLNISVGPDDYTCSHE